MLVKTLNADSRYQILLNEAIEKHSFFKWVCAFQQETGLNKVLRHTKPTKVLIKMNQEYLDKLKEVENEPESWVLMSQLGRIVPFTIFALNKKGEALKKEIKFWSNFYGDQGLFCYDTEEECNKKYNDLIWDNLKSLEREQNRVHESFNKKIETMKEMFVGGTDIVLEILSRESE